MRIKKYNELEMNLVVERINQPIIYSDNQIQEFVRKHVECFAIPVDFSQLYLIDTIVIVSRNTTTASVQVIFKKR